jgi:carboxyl-terminal processing protease
MPPRNLLVLVLAVAACLASQGLAGRTLPGRRFNEVVTLIERAHLAPAATGTLVDVAIEAAVGTLDEHSEYLRGARLEAVESALDQEFVGVGLELEPDPRTGEPVVVTTLPDSPAWRGGMRGGERIVAVDGVPTRRETLAAVVGRLRGPRGTAVALELALPADPPATLDPAAPPPAETIRGVVLVRDLVRMESVLGDRRREDGTWAWRLGDAPTVGLVRISGFGEHTAAEFRSALAALAADGTADAPPLRGLVIDLRGNPGGLLPAAVDVCDQLLADGVIVATRSRADGTAPTVRRATGEAWQPGLPIAVLVDGLTSSAAEIVAACLQDHDRAVVVGSRTFGKGTVQSILPLSGAGRLKLTTAEYLRPHGDRLHRGPRDGTDTPWGVTPDPGLEHTPTRAALERLRSWRRARDMPAAAVAAPDPREIDEVLAKAVSHLVGDGADD